MKIKSEQELFSQSQSHLTWPSREVSLQKFQDFNPSRYAKTRNFLNGHISQMSPQIKHGVIQNRELLSIIRDKFNFVESEKFIQELAWRDFWRSYAYNHPDQLWTDVEEYKTGFRPSDYLDNLPDDVSKGETPTQLINYFIQELIQTGYIHNHARMYLASYVVHFRRVKWQEGAKFFLTHLLDGDIASNNFSWQWIASTFASKPYIFNLENAYKYCHQTLSIDPQQNIEIDGSYEEISARLFPNL